MATEEELIAQAEQRLREGSEGSKRQRSDHPAPAGNVGEPTSEQKLLTQTLRLLLYRSSEVETLLNSTGLVILVKANSLQDKLLQDLELWVSSRPQVTQEQRERREFPEHPLGPKTAYLHLKVTQVLHTLATSKPGCEELAKTLVTLKGYQKAVVQSGVASLKPKFATPKAGRAWKWELFFTAVCTPELRQGWADVIRHLAATKMEEIHVDVRRGAQSQLEQELWTSLKARSEPSRRQ